MKLNEMQKKTNKLSLLNKNVFKKFEPRENVLDYNIKYWLKNGSLIALKKGTYVFNDKYNNEKDKDLFLEYAANQLVKPSYISLEYVMAKFQLLTESVNIITSMTTKTTRKYNNKLGIFKYYTISPKLFCGYKIKMVDNRPIAIASKAKAVFDFLYLRFIKGLDINEQEIKELRINWENLTKKDFKELASYASLTKSRRIKELIKKIC